MGPLNYSAETNLFLQVKSRGELAAWLQISDRRLRFILYRLSSAQKYSSFSIKKRNGGNRHIEAPSEPLKALQRKLLCAVQEVAPPSGVAKGFIRGRSIFDHATRHRSRRWVVLADLADFFPSINFGRVRGAFLAEPFGLPLEVATVVAQLCCKDGVLPQGAPTSPVISNLICRQLDRAIVRIAIREKMTVTRYADDICFSTNLAGLPPAIASTGSNGQYVPGPSLVAAISNSGFALNPAKFRVLERRDRQLVTGLIVNSGVSTTRRWRRQLRVLMHLLEQHGEKKALAIAQGWTRSAVRQGQARSLEQVVRGKVGFAHWIDKKADRSFVQSLHRGYPALRAMLPRLGPSTPFRVMAEGDTDLLHISAALKSFHANGDYLEIQPSFANFSGDKGDAELWETLRRIAKVEVDVLTVGVFDCDNPAFMKKHALEPGKSLRLGNRVYALCLAAPLTLTPFDPFCIESLYDRSDAEKVTDEGRRLFFKDEFDVTGLHVSGLYQRESPLKKALVLSDAVTRLADGASVLLSKMEFAKLVESGGSPFADVKFDGFRATVQVLRDVVDEVERFA